MRKSKIKNPRNSGYTKLTKKGEKLLASTWPRQVLRAEKVRCYDRFCHLAKNENRRDVWIEPLSSQQIIVIVIIASIVE